jgi:hypothetical protein
MASPGAIIEHGSTPTGFGIRQRSNGHLRATSPCCGRTINGNVDCHGCGSSFAEQETSIGATLGIDVPLDNAFLNTWVSNVTGYPEVTVTIL